MGVGIISKNVDSVYLHLKEERYRKTKLQSKVFQECVNCLEETHEFFEAIGFQKTVLPN